MKNNNVIIEEADIVGVLHPKFLIKGIVLLKKPNFILKIDNKIVDFKINLYNNRFYIEKDLKLTDKNIELYLEIRNKQYVVYTNSNNLFKRLKYRFKEVIKKYNFKDNMSDDSLFYNPFNTKDYNKWLKEREEVEVIKKLEYNPLISIVIPVYNIERKFLKDCLDSILNQTYTNFEVCLADDCSTRDETISTLKEYENKDKRIKVVYRSENGHISKATNSAIEIAKGEYVALMDDDDVIPENALYEVVKVLNDDPSIDMIYTDEDKMEMNGTLCDPHFKPDFSPDTLLGGNYICHFSFFRRTILNKIGGFRSEYVGAQDFDLVLRFTEQTDKIYHIPKVLYHWRKVPGSTAVTIDSKGYAIENGRKALEDALKRRKKDGKVLAPINAAHYIVEYEINSNPKISIIIPTKDNASILDKCLKSIYKKTTYQNFEIIVVNNNSEKVDTFRLFDKYKKKYKNFKVLNAIYEFNYSKINNQAVKKAKGEYILFLNNDTEVITDRWLEIMLGYAMQEHIGAVGAKLFYEDGTIQHGGIILGVGGVAAHAYPGVDGNNYGTFGRLLIPYNYSGVTAACLMIKKEKFGQVGGFDEKLKVAYNDVDFNIKLLELGYYNVFLPQVQLIHYESKSRGLDITEEKQKRLLEESEYMKNKWEDKLYSDRFYNPNYSLGKDFCLDKKINNTD